MLSRMKISLGTMEFGRQLKGPEGHKVVKKFLELGYCELDTALMYGDSESVLGTFPECQGSSKVVHIATKANPKEGFSRDDVVKQLNRSLQSLQRDSVDLFYLHWPDHTIPIEETLAGVNQLHQEGKFKEFGLSNFSSWQTVEVWHICKANGYILPTVYQGMYNALTRSCEGELFPALRKYGIRFYVYNPLAGGILSGKYRYTDKDEKKPFGRFFGVDEKWTVAYQQRYWKRELFDAVDSITAALNSSYGSNKVGICEASFRWLTHHSALSADKGDGIILGVSKLQHVPANVKAIEAGPLSEDVVDAFSKAWSTIGGSVPNYYR